LCAKASFAAEAGRTEALQSVNAKPVESAETAEAKFTLVNAVRVAGPDRIIFFGKKSSGVGRRAWRSRFLGSRLSRSLPDTHFILHLRSFFAYISHKSF
jgi:hypothetical protein